jgi:hypothetical protein
MHISAIYVGKSEGNRSIGRHRCREDDNIKMDLKGMVLQGVDCISVAQKRDHWRVYVNTTVVIRVLSEY